MHRTLRAGIAAVALTLIPVADAAAASYGSRTLGKGSSGSDVQALQRYLDRAGYETTADGQFGPATARSMRGFERAEQRKVDGRASRSDQRLVRSRAAKDTAEMSDDSSNGASRAVPGETLDVATEDAYLDESGLAVAPASAPTEVKEIIDAGNKIATKPYKYGGGHGRFRDSGYDCSGSVSYALHGGGLLDTPLDSTGFMSWGERGRGEWVTVYGNSGHAYMVVAGLRFDTSARKRSGNRWSETTRSARGYRVRHPEGL